MGNYDVDYNDKRFTEVENDKNAAINESDKTYDGMINQSDKYFQNQIDAAKDYAETQSKNQQAQTDFAIEQIEQQKGQAEKDYTKEQSAAYTDYQKQIDPYGVNAEQRAAAGLQNTGYSESSIVSMYNQYQSRVATAREAYSRAVLNYDNAIKDARLQNNAVLAEIAYNALQKQLELSLQGFQYKNQLVIEKANKKTELDQIYHNRYKDVLNQINTENALAFQVDNAEENRKIQNAQLALEREKFNWQKSQASKSASVSKGSTGGGSGGSQKSSSNGNAAIQKTANNGANKKDALNELSSARFLTGKQAIAFLTKYGYKVNGSPVDGATWNKNKEAGTDSTEFKYSTYSEYLKGWVHYTIEQA